MALADKPKRCTVYLDPELHKALKLQAAETATNVSELINDAPPLVSSALSSSHYGLMIGLQPLVPRQIVEILCGQREWFQAHGIRP